MISGRVTSEPPALSETRLSSSVAITMGRRSGSPGSSDPPYRTGIESPNAPMSARPFTIESGMSASFRWIASACGAMTSAANRRNSRAANARSSGIPSPSSTPICSMASEAVAGSPAAARRRTAREASTCSASPCRSPMAVSLSWADRAAPAAAMVARAPGRVPPAAARPTASMEWASAATKASSYRSIWCASGSPPPSRLARWSVTASSSAAA